MLTAPAVRSLASCRSERCGRDDDRNKDQRNDHRHADPKRDGPTQPKSATLPFPLTLR
jgi:hypothetical protein